MNRILSKTHILRIILCCLAFLVFTGVHAQDIKVLPLDPAVKTEVLPNGIRCYVVNNAFHKGQADFALVQNTGVKSTQEMDRESLVKIARGGLDAQQRLLSPSVQDYFTSLGAIPGKDGFVSITDDATLYHFKNVNISARKEALDSSLLVLMEIIEKFSSSEDSLIRKWYVPSDHAIVVSGDVDAGNVLDKIRMLSYMIPRSESVSRHGYVWENNAVEITSSSNAHSSVSEVSATWRFPRTPLDKMNTVQPLVVEKYMRAAAIVAKRRASSFLRTKNIPFAEVDCRYVLPENYLGDERFSITVKTDSDDMASAVRAVANVMSSLSAGEIGSDELKSAILEYYDDRLLQEKTLSNSIYVRRCASAFLYNESLASDAEQNKFIMNRSISGDAELAIFKSMMSAYFTPESNLSLNCTSPDVALSQEAVDTLFHDAWVEKTLFPFELKTPVLVGAADKIKVQSVKKEYLSGGTLWTLSNGVRVIVKQTDAKDVVNWAFIASGGFGNIKDLKQGEAAYFSEYLDMCTMGGLSSEEFHDAIRLQGMTMNVEMKHSSTCFSGRIPDDGLEYLVRILLTQMKNTEPDQSLFEYHKKCESLRLSSLDGTLEQRITSIDSLICPDYRYSVCRSGYSDEFMSKAESAFNKIWSCSDAGVLVLIGDVDEKKLKEVLVTYAGGFKTLGRKPSRPVVNYQPISGTIQINRTGDQNCVDMVMSAQMPLSVKTYYTAELTSLCLRKACSKAVTGRGLHIRLNHNCSHYPHERVSLMLSLREASVEGFATGTSYYEPMEALGALRALLKDLSLIEVTDAELASYKALLKQRIKRRLSDPMYWYEIFEQRYVEGKDYYSSYEAKIDSITKDDIKQMLQMLSDGARVEYVIEK